MKESGASQAARLALELPWPEMLAAAFKYGRQLFRGLSHEGMYQTLDYETTLELLDKSGKKAVFSKRKKVRYLQDNIIAYPDYAWGDGKILQNYRCTPGKAVDRYRAGFKTYVLISLRDVKNRGDEDEFNIRWSMLNGFLKPDGFWDTDISHRTKHIRIHIIFPKERPPRRVNLVESNHHRTHYLSREYHKYLPDGRIRVTWEKKRPRLFEHYLMRWRW
jgi:hypothetical protein